MTHAHQLLHIINDQLKHAFMGIQLCMWSHSFTPWKK